MSGTPRNPAQVLESGWPEPASRADRALARVSGALLSSLDAEAVLNALLGALVPDVADYCQVELLAEPGADGQATFAMPTRTLTQGDSSRFELDAGHADPWPVVARNAIDAVAPVAEARQVSLRLEARGTVPLLDGDAERLEQVVWNLLSNAVKFSNRAPKYRP